LTEAKVKADKTSPTEISNSCEETRSERTETSTEATADRNETTVHKMKIEIFRSMKISRINAADSEEIWPNLS
jgi:hypothetical protein